jgi:hypothetical protein
MESSRESLPGEPAADRDGLPVSSPAAGIVDPASDPAPRCDPHGGHRSSKASPKPPEVVGVGEDVGTPNETPGMQAKLKSLLIGGPRDLGDKALFHSVSLVAFLAWVGLGADGLSSSCYGPPEAFINLGPHRYLAVFLAGAIVATVFIIATCYSHIIEVFPSGGGGYLVASALMGRRAGVVSGCALLVDYVLTITVSIASSGDALFSLLPADWGIVKLPVEFALIVGLMVLNMRGIKESVQVLVPIFLLFLVAHVILITGAITQNLSATADVARGVCTEVRQGFGGSGLGLLGMLALLLHAYSLGGGTYTGLEAVSNSMPVIREPRVPNAKRTMLYMAFSLAFTAGGLILAYLLLDIRPAEGKTMNYLLTHSFVEQIGLGVSWLGPTFLVLTLVSEGALLIVAAQAGFIDGPRVVGYMAHDSWMPRWFSNLSDRLATQNGILLMGVAALGALWYTGGDIGKLVIMYSINVFLTFSLSMIGMCRHWFQERANNPLWRRRLALFVVGAALCVSILCITTIEKFREGGWITLLATGICVGLAFSVHRYYTTVGEKLRVLDETLGSVVPSGAAPNLAEPDPTQPTAIILVGRYSGLGIHTMLNVVRFAPNYFKNFVFVSVGVVDSGNFKGGAAVDELRKHTQEQLDQYVDLARHLGMPAAGVMKIGTDAVVDLEQMCCEVVKKYPRSTVFAGQLVFEKDTWLHRLLHNQTAYSLQRRLQWTGLPMVILPTRVR